MVNSTTVENELIAPGVYRLSRTQVRKKRRSFKPKVEGAEKVKKPKGVKRKPKCDAEAPKHTGPRPKTGKARKYSVDYTATKSVEVKGDKNGGTRKVALHKAPRWYPTEKVKPKRKGAKKAGKPKLKAGITPGSVLILLAGRFKGKRVVFLKQLENGMLLVTGPFKINGVPLRRVNQAYVIATSTKVDLCDFEVDAKFNDAYFTREKVKKSKCTEEEFFGDKSKKTPLPDFKSADQKTVDAGVLAAVKKTPFLCDYLRASFSLSNRQAPHAMKF